MRRLATSAALAALALAAPAGAVPPRAAEPPARAAAMSLAARLRPLPYETRLAALLGHAAGLDGRAAGPLAPRVAPLPGAVPPRLTAPLGRLLGAVRDATALTRAATRAAGPAPRVTFSGTTPGVGVDPRVDRTALAVAAATVLDAVDDVRPALAGSAPSAARATGCDVLDAAPYVCVGGPGANTHAGDYALLVDLGGNDRYTGATGGADPERGGPPVAVALDLGGDDTYAADVATTTAVLGAGRRGVGVLVDVAGDDAYLVRTAAGADPLLGAAALGAGINGVGVHADLDGADTYDVVSTLGGPTPAGPSGSVTLVPLWAAGAGEGGLGVHLDAGGDADVHTIASRPDLVTHRGRLHFGRTVARGLGFGGAGVGLALDDGGRATQHLASVTHLVEPPPTGPVEPRQVSALQGYGAGALGGTGALVAGAGAGTRLARAFVETPGGRPAATLDAFGAGGSFATGLLLDAGGDDHYSGWASAAAVRSTKSGRLADSGPVRALMIGAGDGGTGALLDALGDDTYSAMADNAAHVRGTGPRTASVEATALFALGVAAPGGAGLLADGAGDDRYESYAIVFARATARALGPVTHVALGATHSGYGELTDLGGADRYGASTFADPDPPLGVTETFFAGTGPGPGGVAVFADVGGRDSFLPTEGERCFGRPGDVVWQGCGGGAGVGSNT